MSTNEPSDTAVAEADQRAERAKASLLSRVEQLKHKLGDARHKLDLRSQIAKHPLPAIGIAVVLGAAAASRFRSSASGGAVPHSLTGTALAALTALGLRMVREVALGQLGHVAKQWLVEHGGVPSFDARTPQVAGRSAH